MRNHCRKRDHELTPENTSWQRWINGKLYPHCKACAKISRKAWYEKHGLKSHQRLDGSIHPCKARLRRAWKKRNPEKNCAHVAVSVALKKGVLRKEPCMVCGDPIVQAHHHNGYEKEHRLDVQWLCRQHHDTLHKMEIEH